MRLRASGHRYPITAREDDYVQLNGGELEVASRGGNAQHALRPLAETSAACS